MRYPSPKITIHSKNDFDGMKKAGEIAARVLNHVEQFVKIGVSTNELNDICHEMILENGAIPAPLNYKGFPKSICTSINEVICHGIPSERKLLDGDIINIDVTVIFDGWHGDTSKTFIVGKAAEESVKLVKVTYESMMIGISKVRSGVNLRDIGYAIQNHAENNGYSVVRDYCGHGIGKKFHDEPQVLHYYNKYVDVTLKEGMFLTIEPMINIGQYHTKTLDDKWTVVTADGSLSAQFEHTIGVTKDGYVIFTSL